jgi:hypothetical protein
MEERRVQPAVNLVDVGDAQVGGPECLMLSNERPRDLEGDSSADDLGRLVRGKLKGPF